MPIFLLACLSWLLFLPVASPNISVHLGLVRSLPYLGGSNSVPTDLDKQWNADGNYQLAWVVDPGLATLRTQPELTARCIRRLRLGRKLYVVGSKYSNTMSLRYYYVAVTRRTRGYIDPAALVIAGKPREDRRLMRLITNAKDVDKILLAQIFTQAFPRSAVLPDVWLAEGFAAESIAIRLSAQAQRRRALPMLDPTISSVRYWQNWAILDRYNRLGINWRFDLATLTFSYDGKAFERLLRRYPQSTAAAIVREKLRAMASQSTPTSSPKNAPNPLIPLPLIAAPNPNFPLVEQFDPEEDL
jgi:hypothetical protein